MSTGINVTYDLLFDILRYEKSRDELQALDEDFFKNISEYLEIKQVLLLNVNTPTGERELTRIQINNVKKILTELYERRERKIINLALYKIKTGSELVNSVALLKEEKFLFDSIFDVLFKYRSQILEVLLDNKVPNPTSTLNSMNTLETPLNSVQKKSMDSQEESFDIIKSVRFLKPVPKFLGPELENYGPYEEYDIASIPSRIANILIRKERAEEIKSE